MVDEVYLDAAFERKPRNPPRLLDDHFIVTSSLTKVYGLSGLRCGWILAEPKLAETMWRLNDLFGIYPGAYGGAGQHDRPGELPRIAKNVRERLIAIACRMHRFLIAARNWKSSRLRSVRSCFRSLKRGSVDQMCDLLRTKYETTVVPGKFFEMPDHFRIGIGGDTGAAGRRTCGRLGLALDDMMENS